MQEYIYDMWLYLHVHCSHLTLLCDGLSEVLGLGTQIADHMIHGSLVFQEEWADHALVQHLGAVPRHGSHAPYQEQTLRGESRGQILCDIKQATQADITIGSSHFDHNVSLFSD